MIKLTNTNRMSSNFLIVLEGRLEMIFYDGGAAPNARRVRVFLYEKNIDIPIKSIDIMKGDHKKDDYKKISPLSQVPALELDDGTFITESIAICRYIEELNPEPNLFGKNPKEIAQIENVKRKHMCVIEILNWACWATCENKVFQLNILEACVKLRFQITSVTPA